MKAFTVWFSIGIIIVFIFAGLIILRLQRKILIPSVICTKIDCLPVRPCCNSCLMDGWDTDDHTAVAKSVITALPVYPVDGCGRITGGKRVLDALGVLNGSRFYVFLWREYALEKYLPGN